MACSWPFVTFFYKKVDRFIEETNLDEVITDSNQKDSESENPDNDCSFEENKPDQVSNFVDDDENLFDVKTVYPYNDIGENLTCMIQEVRAI